VSEQGTTEPEAAAEQPVVIGEPDEEEKERKRSLDEQLETEGYDVEADSEGTGERGLGSPASLIAEARSHIGYREASGNDAVFNHWYGTIGGIYGYAWCHVFVSYCLWHSDNAGAGPKTAGCRDGWGWFAARNRTSSTPQVGDIVYYGANGGDHVEIVSGVSPSSIMTIGGNTSGSFGGQVFNGDGVYEKSVDRHKSSIHGYGRPLYGAGTQPDAGGGGDAATVEPMTSVRSIQHQQEAVNGLGYKPPLHTDGEWGPKTAAGVKWLQKKVGAGADGQWGDETEEKFRTYRP